MLIEINYQQPSQAQGTGSVQAHRLVRVEDLLAVDPHASEPSKSVVQVLGSASGFVQGSTTYTLNESYDAFKTRYGQAMASPNAVSSAPAVQSTQVSS